MNTRYLRLIRANFTILSHDWIYGYRVADHRTKKVEYFETTEELCSSLDEITTCGLDRRLRLRRKRSEFLAYRLSLKVHEIHNKMTPRC